MSAVRGQPSRLETGRAPTAEALRGKLRLADIEVARRRVLVRVDFNVPVRAGKVADDTRIVAALPVLHELLRAEAAVVVASHRGRPKGRRDPEASMAPVAEALAERLGAPVPCAGDCVGPDVREQIRRLRPGSLLLLENLRFHAGETANDEAFARDLAEPFELYVDDAFGVCHRAHASVVGVPRQVEAAAAGPLVEREVSMLSRVLMEPAPPFVLVLGGAKVEDKVGVITNLLPLVDRIVIGGAMANAFLAAAGRAIGGSLAPEAAIEQARRLRVEAEAAGVEVVLPTDLVAAPGLDRPEQARVVHDVASEEMALDIGPDSRQRFAAAVADARTVVWNGPMGVFESAAFAAGTMAVARALGALPSDVLTVVGGGDTAAAATAAGVASRVTHVSTGGGAALELLSGAILPGVAALTDR